MFAQAVIDALDFYDKDRKYYDEISQRCSKYSRNRYDWGMIAEQWKKLIRNLNEKVRR
jgi:glycosyltransferase involved in cell wall biosynthesis